MKLRLVLPALLAVSLHAATEEERAKLIPANQRWPLAELIAACRSYNAQTGRRIFFAWTLIHGVNDTPEHAKRIAELLHGLDAHINLIPLNRTEGYTGTESSDAAADTFHRILQDAGFRVSPEERPVQDLNQDGIVLDQTPPGDSSAKPGATVTVVVGAFQPGDLDPGSAPDPAPGPTDPATPAP